MRKDSAIDDLITEQHDQPLRRPDELFPKRGPAHALGDRQLIERCFDDSRKQLGGCLAGYRTAVSEFRAAAVDFCQINAAFASKAQGCLGRLAFCVEGRLQRRPIEVGAAVRLFGVELLDQYRQTPRGGEGLHPTMLEAGVLQALLDACAERVGQFAQGLGRQLFGAELDQEIQCTHSAASNLASTSSRRSGVAMGKPSLARACK